MRLAAELRAAVEEQVHIKQAAKDSVVHIQALGNKCTLMVQVEPIIKVVIAPPACRLALHFMTSLPPREQLPLCSDMYMGTTNVPYKASPALAPSSPPPCQLSHC